MFNTIFIFVPSFKQIVRISEGSGDNLLDEDIEAGYVDYIYYEQFNLDTDVAPIDGGQIMLTELFQEKFSCTNDAIPYVLDMAYRNKSIKYIVLE